MTIGVVSEGTTDYLVIEQIVLMLDPDCTCYYIHPDVSTAAYGNGWQGVWQWCLESKKIIAEQNKILSHKIDLYIIHLDGDTTREKQLHCDSPLTCTKNPIDSPARCHSFGSYCPLVIPNAFTQSAVAEKVDFLKNKISNWMGADIPSRVLCCLPFDSPESWIVAAFDGDSFGNPELIENPAETVIGKSATYHGHKIKKSNKKFKKTRSFYNEFLIPQLCDQWSKVKRLCTTAQLFQDALETYISKPQNQ